MEAHFSTASNSSQNARTQGILHNITDYCGHTNLLNPALSCGEIPRVIVRTF